MCPVSVHDGGNFAVDFLVERLGNCVAVFLVRFVQQPHTAEFVLNPQIAEHGIESGGGHSVVFCDERHRHDVFTLEDILAVVGFRLDKLDISLKDFVTLVQLY